VRTAGKEQTLRISKSAQYFVSVNSLIYGIRYEKGILIQKKVLMVNDQKFIVDKREESMPFLRILQKQLLM